MPTLEAYDVAVIGAGVVGCCTARELAKYQLRIIVLEAGLDIASGATRANSGIVHAGYDPQPGTCKAAYNVRGAQMFGDLQRQLGFSYRKNGALVIAFSQDQVAALEELRLRAVENGAPECFVVGQEELRSLEPNVSQEAVAALHVPDSGVVDGYGFTHAMAENAANNGVEFSFDCAVTAVEKLEDGDGYQILCANGSTINARAVVNAAGVNADIINNMVSNVKLAITPRRGEYHLFKEGVSAFGHTMFPLPTAAGKGVLVGVSAFGNQFIGPNAVYQESRQNVETTQEGLRFVMEQAQRIWPDAQQETVISNFAGIRASNAQTGDFVIGAVEDAPGFFNAACIDSPGLTAAPAIGCDLALWVAQYLNAAPNENFDPVRIPAPLLVMMGEEDKAKMAELDPRYGESICRCCHVSEGEVVAALHRSIPVLCFDALKWRTGVVMGECQGGRCSSRILTVMAQELGVDPCDIPKRAQGSWLVTPQKCACEVPLPPRPNKEYEKPRSTYRIAGSRPAGVFSAFGAWTFMARTGYLPGTKVVVWGSLDIADQCTQWLEKAGAQVTRLRSGEITNIAGGPRVESVTVDGVAYPCDAVVVSDHMIKQLPK